MDCALQQLAYISREACEAQPNAGQRLTFRVVFIFHNLRRARIHTRCDEKQDGDCYLKASGMASGYRGLWLSG